MQTTQYASLPTEQRQRCEVWTRVMGYHRPVSQFNIGKRAEHQESSDECADKPFETVL